MNELILYKIINSLPYCVFIKDINLCYMVCNDNFLQTTGFQKSSSIIGKSDFDMPWSKKQATLYQKDDLEVIQSQKPKLNYLEFQSTLSGKESINLVSKWPIQNQQNQIVGVLCIYNRLTVEHPLLLCLENVSQAFIMEQEAGIINFTPLETKIIYYLIRGKSAQQIAKKLQISNRTVESYTEIIKNKMNLTKKSDVIETIIDYVLKADKIHCL